MKKLSMMKNSSLTSFQLISFRNIFACKILSQNIVIPSSLSLPFKICETSMKTLSTKSN